MLPYIMTVFILAWAGAPPAAPPEASSWAMSTMLAWAPLDRKVPWQELQGETELERRARYAELADAASAVAFAPDNPPLFPGAHGRARTLALLLSVSWFESAFYNRVTSDRGKDDRSDGGKSWCAAQILIGKDGIGKRKGGHLERMIPEGWRGQELEQDARKCMTVAYRFLAASFDRCKASPVKYRMGAYTGEGCGRAPKSANRIKKALELADPTWTDADVADKPPPSRLASAE